MLCKENYKAWKRVCPLKKQEIDYIAQILLFISHYYFIKFVIMRINSTTLNKNVFYKTDINITLFFLLQ